MRLVTANEMKKIDSTAINEFGIHGVVLMENAGRSVVVKCMEKLGLEYKSKRVIVFAGKGNNGGDGLVIARHLINKGIEVKVFLLCRPSELKGDAEINFNILKKMHGKIFAVTEEKDLHRVDIAMMYADLIVDAIYGTGFKGIAKGIIGEILEMISNFKRTVISVDLPSGLEADTGKINGPCIKADYTLTFGLPKIGLFLEPGASYCGELEVVDISIPSSLLMNPELKKRLITKRWCSEIIPKRKNDTHKGDYGHILVVGGSSGMTGAITLACQGALRTGAGLVTAGVPRSLNEIFEQKMTEAMTKPLPETESLTIGREAVEQVLEFSKKVSVLVIGPGMSVNASGIHFVKTLLPKLKVPVVLDADGLNNLAHILEEDADFIKNLKAPIVLTPHPGEMARLTGLTIKEIQENRLQTAVEYASIWGKIVVLKGTKTIIASPDGSIYLNATGNPGMSTGGSGDVLTGIISSLIAQGLDISTASAVGVFLHGAAGDKAENEKGEYGMTAGDIIKYLPQTLKLIEKKYRNKYINVVYNE